MKAENFSVGRALPCAPSEALNKRTEDCPPYLGQMHNYRRLAQAPLQDRLLSHALRDDFSQRLYVFGPSVLVNDGCALARDVSGGE